MSERWFYEEISRETSVSESVAPNGSARCTDYWTVIVKRETWADVPENGIYAGCVYRITERYLSLNPNTLGQYIGSRSEPWAAGR